jgi:hypothetical protein
MDRQARRFGEKASIIGKALIIVAVAALIGGRLYHVIDQWQLYKDNLSAIVLPPTAGSASSAASSPARSRSSSSSATTISRSGAGRTSSRRHLLHAGGRSRRQLLQPGAVRAADLAAVGDRDRLCAPRRGVPVHHVPARHTHFHPLFLYESLSGLLGAAVLIWLSTKRRPQLRVGDLAAIMFIWIGGVRFLIEFLRIGNWRLGDIPTAQLFGAAFVLIGIGILVMRRRQGAPILEPAPAGSADAEDGDGEAPPDDMGEDDFKELDEAMRARG